MSIGEWTRDWANKEFLPVNFQPSMTSTNSVAKEGFTATSRMNLVLTDSQTHGRGRGNHTWITPSPGSCLLSSWCMTLTTPPQPVLTPKAGLGLIRAASQVWPQLSWSLKAPNDLYIGQMKVGGLLIEVVSEGDKHNTIIGLGMNIQDRPNLTIATDIKSQLGRDLRQGEWNAFLRVWFSELQMAFKAAHAPELTTSECAELQSSLNKNPLTKNSIKRIHPNGSIEYQDGAQTKTVNWSDL